MQQITGNPPRAAGCELAATESTKREATGVPATIGPKGTKRGRPLVIGALGRRRSKTMPLRSRSRDTASPPQTQASPAAEPVLALAPSTRAATTAFPGSGRRMADGLKRPRFRIGLRAKPEPPFAELPPPIAEPPFAELPPPIAELPPPIAEQLTVPLIKKASSDLRRTHERTQLSRADIVNRAVSFYEFVDAEQHAGSELIIRRRNGEQHIVKFI
jgi:hypothetical protein